MLLTLTAISWAILAYVFRAQIPTFIATARADFSWVKSWFTKTAPVVVAPVVVVPAPVAAAAVATAAASVAAAKV